MDTREALQIAQIIKASDIRECARIILDEEDGDDFTFEVDGAEYRIIHDDSIESIFADEIREQVDESYDIKGIKDKIGKIGSYFEFDYESYVRDCHAGGSYGGHFSTEDGSEESVGPWNIFRIG